MPEGTTPFKKILLVIIIWGCRFLQAQPANYNLERLTAADGLAASEINTLFQDSRHYMWIGHKAGVSRFDGYSFENLLFAGKQRLGIVYAIIESSDGTIWIGAEEGLFFYRNETLHFANLQLQSPAVNALAFDDRGDLFLGTGEGLASINAAKLHGAMERKTVGDNRKTVPFWYKKPPNLSRIKFISIPAIDQLFISDGHIIVRIDKNQAIQVHAMSDLRDYITGMIALNRDSIYASSQLSGLWLLENQTVKRFYFSKGIGNALVTCNKQLLYFAVEGIYSINPGTGSAKLLLSIPAQYREWGTAVLQDKENNFWISSHEELLVARPRLFRQHDSLQLTGFDELYSMYQNSDGSILVGANRGRIFKSDTNQLHFALWNQVFPLAEVFDIHVTRGGDMWFCSGYQGLSLLRKGVLSRFTKVEGLRNNSNYKFLTNSKGNLFVCGDDGVTGIVYNPDSSIKFENYFIANNGKVYTVINSILEKPDGSLLFGSDHGLWELKNDSLYASNIKGSLDNAPSVTDIKQDENRNVWISTVGDGILLLRFDSGNNLVLERKFSVSDGLSAMIYLQLLVDQNNSVWATGYKGITHVEQNKGGFSVSTYGEAHGLVDKSFHAVRMLQDAMGQIWIATSSGLVSLNPADFKRAQQVPAIVIDRTSIMPRRRFAADNKMTDSGKIDLPYNFTSISFHFTGIYFTDPSAVRYAYRLKPTDSNWTDAGVERIISFQNLPPGNYTFEAKASIGNSEWSDPVSYQFTVLSPFWQRWWFILISLAILTGLLIYLVHRRETVIKKKEAQKTEIEKLRAVNYRYQLEIEQVTNYFANVISQQKNIDDLLWDVTRNCMSKLGFQDCVIYLKEDTMPVLIQKAAWGPKTSEENKILNPIEISMGEGIVGSVAASGKPEIIRDTRTDKRYIVDDVYRLSEISVPIISDGKVIGVIDSEHSQTDFYTDRHLQILTTIAALCADKINKIKAEEKTKAKEVELMKLNNDLTTSQLIALRSQMNPHFIFNSLNSIAQLVASMQTESGLEYLNKFAAFLRIILEQSENNFILLKDEIRLLELYLQLESLRFGSSFVFKIQTDPDLEAEDLMVPSFIIHPIVENAIWHGLMHKKGDRRLVIEFRRKNTDELLCIVKDNGIGVEAAKEIKKKLPGSAKQQSKGLKMVNDRLTILGREFSTSSNVLIEDLGGNGYPGGTKVTIHLPVINDL